jgi:hypothetical protein
MAEKPKVIVMCGSSRFVQEMAVCAWLLERDEGAITLGLHLLPPWYPTECDDHLAEAENCAPQMDELHLRKIDLANEIFVVNVGYYVGESTEREAAYALKRGCDIRYYTDDPIGHRVKAMILEAYEKQKKAEAERRG